LLELGQLELRLIAGLDQVRVPENQGTHVIQVSCRITNGNPARGMRSHQDEVAQTQALDDRAQVLLEVADFEIVSKASRGEPKASRVVADVAEAIRQALVQETVHLNGTPEHLLMRQRNRHDEGCPIASHGVRDIVAIGSPYKTGSAARPSQT
jgi:hypothetical protein